MLITASQLTSVFEWQFCLCGRCSAYWRSMSVRCVHSGKWHAYKEQGHNKSLNGDGERQNKLSECNPNSLQNVIVTRKSMTLNKWTTSLKCSYCHFDSSDLSLLSTITDAGFVFYAENSSAWFMLSANLTAQSVSDLIRYIDFYTG